MAGDSKIGRDGACHVTECIRRRSVLQTGAMRFDEDVGRCVPIVNTGWPVKRCGLGGAGADRPRISSKARTEQAPTLSWIATGHEWN